MTHWRLEFEFGGQLSLRPGVTLIGRDPACDVVLSDSTISRRQLLLQTRADGVELVKLGRQTVRCDGVEIDDEPVLAEAGARVFIGDVPFAQLHRLSTAECTPRWLLSVDGGPGLPLTREHFTLGDGPADVLNIPGWPEAALRLHELDAGVVVELAAAANELLDTHEAAQFDGDGFARLDDDRELHIAGHTLRALPTASLLATRTRSEVEAPVLVRLESYRRGGVVTIERGERVQTVYLSRLRYALIRTLLQPPAPYSPGEYVNLVDLCDEIWPDNPSKTEYDFNVLLHRVRQDLIRSEVDVDALIERAHGSGRVRAPIAADATIIDADAG